MTATPPYRLEIEPTAAKGLRAMPARDGKALLSKLERIATDPFAPRAYATKLQGRPAYRVRQGNWRAIYLIDRTVRVMLVSHVGHRREIYRQ